MHNHYIIFQGLELLMNGGDKDAYFSFQETDIRDEMYRNITKQTGKFYKRFSILYLLRIF